MPRPPQWTRTVRVILLGAGTLLLLAGCVSPPRPPAATVPAAPPPRPPAEGASSYRFLLDESAYRAAVAEGEEFIKPYAMGALALPEYPQAPLAARWGNATVAVRIWVGETGAIDTVEDSPIGASTPGRFAADFRAAVEAAVRRWRLTAGEIVTFRPCQSYPNYQPPKGCKERDTSRNVRVFYDVRFDFEIVEGEGHVTLGGAATP